MSALIPCRWTGEAFAPLPRFAREADRHFVVGQVYPMLAQEDPSSATRRHFFAVVRACWQSLPEHLVERFPSPKALRKYALIKAGFCDQTTLAARSRVEADRIAAFVQPDDAYVIVTVTDNVVTRYRAHSQRMNRMNKETFARSKEGVFNVIAEMIGVDPATLANQAEAA